MSEDSIFLDSSTDPSINVSQIIKENEDLKQYNTKLEEKLQKILIFNNKNEETRSNTQIKQLTTELNDAKAMLNMCINENNELKLKLTNQINIEKKQNEDYVKSLSAIHLNEIKKLKVEIEILESKNKELNNKICTQTNNILKTEAQFPKLLNAANDYFQQNFDTIPQLIKFLNVSLPPEQADANKIKIRLVEQENLLNDLNEEVKQLKHANKKLQRQLADKDSQQQLLEEKYEQIIEQKEQVYYAEIIKKEQKITGLKAELQNNEQKIEIPELSISLKTSFSTQGVQTQQIVESDSQSEEDLLETPSEIYNQCKKQFESYYLELEQIQELNKHQQQKINELKLTVENLKNENKSLTEKNYEQEKKFKSHQQNTEFEEFNQKINEEIKDSSEYIDSFSLLLEQQAKELTELSNSRSSMLEIIAKQQNAIHTLEDQLRQKNELKQTPQPVVATPVVHLELNDLPRDLVKVLEGIANNTSLEVGARMNSIIAIIGRYIQKCQNEMEHKCASFEDKLKMLQNAHNSLVSDLCKVLDTEEYKIIDEINSVIDKSQEFKEQNENMSNQVKAILFETNTKTVSECINKFKNITSEIDSIYYELESSEKLLESIKEEYMEYRSQQESAAIEREKNSENSQKILKKSKETINEQSKIIEELNQRNSKLIECLNEQKWRDSETVKLTIKRLEDQVQYERERRERAESEFENYVAEYTESVKAGNAKIAEANKLRREAETKVHFLEAQLQEATERESQTALAAKRLYDENANESQQRIEEAEGNQRMIEERYGSEIERMRDEINDINTKRAELAKAQSELAKALRESEQKRRREGIALRSEVEQLRRQLRLNEAASRAELIAAQGESLAAIDVVRAECRAELQSVFSFAAQMFREKCDLRKTLDGDSFRELLGKVRDELELFKKNEEAVRSLIGAGDRPTVEALTHFVVDKLLV